MSGSSTKSSDAKVKKKTSASEVERFFFEQGFAKFQTSFADVFQDIYTTIRYN